MKGSCAEGGLTKKQKQELNQKLNQNEESFYACHGRFDDPRREPKGPSH